MRREGTYLTVSISRTPSVRWLWRYTHRPWCWCQRCCQCLCLLEDGETQCGCRSTVREGEWVEFWIYMPSRVWRTSSWRHLVDSLTNSNAHYHNTICLEIFNFAATMSRSLQINCWQGESKGIRNLIMRERWPTSSDMLSPHLSLLEIWGLEQENYALTFLCIGEVPLLNPTPDTTWPLQVPQLDITKLPICISSSISSP
jgi:hypothetical protein